MMNNCKIPSFWPMGNLQAASMTSKITVPKMYLPIFNFEDVVETLVDTLKNKTL